MSSTNAGGSFNTMKVGVNQPASVTAAALIISFAALFYNISPVIIGAAAAERSLGDEQLGLLLVPGMIALAVVSLVLTKWVRRCRWKSILVWGGGLMLVGNLLALFASSFSLLMFTFGIVGVGGGLLYSIAMVCLGDAERPDRGFGIAQLLQAIVGMICLYSIPILIAPKWGFSGVLILLASGGLISVALVAWFPSQGKSVSDHAIRERTPFTEETASVVAVLAVSALFVYTMGVSGLWIFYERIGSDMGFSSETIGEILSVAFAIGAFGAFLPVFLRDRFDRNRVILLLGIVFISMVFGLSRTPGETGFLILSVIFQLCWAASLPYLFAAIAAADTRGRVVVLIPAVYGISSAVGSAIAGYTYSYGYQYLLALTITLVFLSSVIPFSIPIIQRRKEAFE